MKIIIDLSDPSILGDSLRAMADLCIKEADKIDPNKRSIKGGMYRTANIRLVDYANKIDKRFRELIKEMGV